MLAHPLHLHLQLLYKKDCCVTVLSYFKYKSIYAELVNVVGDSWILKTDHASITWHSSKGVKEEFHDEIVSALLKYVEGLNSSEITRNSSYFYGKSIARVAWSALIAEEPLHQHLHHWKFLLQKCGGNMYEKEFTKNNKRHGLWFGPAEWKECWLGIQLLPLLPISEILSSDVKYVKGLVEWTLPFFRKGWCWRGFV
ncbi:glycoside hydrolase family 81 protein [Medicago truncatula]|uniref:glucan endo-1,3-beta-D-glucosidase n=1 Tax=Medicago truncatula TaxID=3880 RepID=A0A072U707_MEDTR|nr:glycoside hydrolase family 81 protein [Medicago truncatula]